MESLEIFSALLLPVYYGPGVDSVWG